MSLHHKASQAHRRGHWAYHGGDHINPYRPGSFKHRDWQFGHDDAANSAYWAERRSAEQKGEEFVSRDEWFAEFQVGAETVAGNPHGNERDGI